jgi:hypothetical protein
VIYFATLIGSPDEIVIHPEDHSVGTWFSEADLTHVYNSTKTKDDPEYVALRKAFRIMNGESLNLAANS